MLVGLLEPSHESRNSLTVIGKVPIGFLRVTFSRLYFWLDLLWNTIASHVGMEGAERDCDKFSITPSQTD